MGEEKLLGGRVTGSFDSVYKAKFRSRHFYPSGAPYGYAIERFPGTCPYSFGDTPTGNVATVSISVWISPQKQMQDHVRNMHM